ncbi:MAG: hypothetical protein RIR11_784 [Bacteroidota bacterium]|jgi:hypothetical protein
MIYNPTLLLRKRQPPLRTNQSLGNVLAVVTDRKMAKKTQPMPPITRSSLCGMYGRKENTSFHLSAWT